MAEELPLVSVIVPCRNEVRWIAPCLDSILANGYPADRLEVLVVDGMSDDGTRAIVEDFCARHSQVRLLDNVKRITPAALNVGIAAAQGAIVMRMDAHVEYPLNYISILVHELERSGADNVGGVCLTCPANETAVARAIAVGMSHPLGVGNAYFRIGVSESRWVYTAPFGCYRREIFERIGGFDEELVRDQDDEFNLRLIRAGGRILLVPEVVSKYYARDSLLRLWRMYFQYGYFKPLVIRKIGRVMTLRQVVPALFLAALAVLGIGALCSTLALGALIFLVGSYLLAIAGVASTVLRKQGPACASWLFAVFPAMHFAYGVGFFQGAIRFLLFHRSGVKDAAKVPISR